MFRRHTVRHGKGRHAAAAWQNSASQWLHESVAVVSAAVLLTLSLSLFWRPVVVQGESMLPTLVNNDRLILYCFHYSPERGDIVVIRRENDEPLIKRVIGVAGDTVHIYEQRVYLNGELLEEPYLADAVTPSMQFERATVVPEGHIFVMGDNRTNSHDSRHADIGMVSTEAVVGKAVFRMDPFTGLEEK